MKLERHEHHVHNHYQGGELSGTRFFIVTLLNIVITVAEIVGGIISGSLSLLSDALHNFSDSIAVFISFFAYRLAKKKPNSKMSFGYPRAEILAAFINTASLLGISLFLIYEAIQRFIYPQAIVSDIMIWVSIVGLLANVISVLILQKDKDHNTNIKATYLHILSDAISSVGVVVGGIIIKFWGFNIIDPIITLLISLYIIREAWRIIKETTAILMQSSVEFDYEEIEKSLLDFKFFHNIHHIHSWKLNEKKIYFEAHIVVDDMMLSKVDTISIKIENYLKETFGIYHCTLKFETENICKSKQLFNLED